ncbi:MAG: FAD:protein FMN transferase, partial [Luteolibacter sp.]
PNQPKQKPVAQKKPMPTIRRCTPLLGTYVEIEISGDSSEDHLLDLTTEAFAEISRIQALMSFHDPESELSKINHLPQNQPLTLSPETTQVLTLALELHEKTSGLFDIASTSHLIRRALLPGPIPETPATSDNIHLANNTISLDRPLKIDLGGIAKGYAIDRALATIPPGIQAIVNAGGDLAMTHWQQETAHIRVPSGQGATIPIEMQRPALASSSACFSPDGENAIIHPETGTPAPSDRTVSVFAPTGMLADALTKIASLSPHSKELLESYRAIAYITDVQGNTTPAS